MFSIVHQLNIWGYVYILLFLYKQSSSQTDCSVFARETHDGMIIKNKMFIFKSYFHKVYIFMVITKITVFTITMVCYV